MTECKQEVFEFQVHGSRKVTGDFSGGYLSSDGGAVFLRGVDLKMGLIERLGGCFSDYRLPCLVEHKVTELLRQRIGALALGYEDLNDHDRLRLDPLHALIAGKADVLGEDRLCEGDKGKALAAHSTLNRLELGALGGDTRYKKIIAKPQEIEALLIEEGVKAIPRKSREIILDFDATDDPLHGNQEGAFFHGYYRNYCYLPLYCFCGNIPLLAQLRDAKRDASSGTVEALRKITCAIRKRFGRKVRIIVRADSGFAREEIMAWCEDNGVYYCLGLARNKRLSARLGKCFGELHRGIQSGEIQVPCRRFARARAGAARAGWWAKPRSSTKGPIRALWLPTFPLKAYPVSPKNALQLPRSTRSFTAPAEKWKTASRRRSRTSLLIAPARAGWPPTNSGSGSRLSLISWSRCCGLRCCGVLISPALPSARSGSSFSRLVPASRSVADAFIWS
jgi:Transposase DDE domain group 1